MASIDAAGLVDSGKFSARWPRGRILWILPLALSASVQDFLLYRYSSDDMPFPVQQAPHSLKIDGLNSGRPCTVDDDESE